MINTLHIVMNNEVKELAIEEIFDHDRFDTFVGITFSVSPSFMNRYLEGFEKVEIVVGIPENRVQFAANEAAKNLKMKIEGILNNEPAELYQSLSTKVKAKLNNQAVELFIPLGYNIHSKFYLMSHSISTETRIVVGSANLSEQAFSTSSNQFENIIILDNNKLFDLYHNYYTQVLSPILTNYIPQELLKINAKKISNLEESGNLYFDEVIHLSNKEVELIKEKAIVETLEETNSKVALGVLPVEVPEQMRNISDNRRDEEREQRKLQVNETTAYSIVKEAIMPRAKEATIKSTRSITKMIQQKIKVKVHRIEEDGLPGRPMLVNSPEDRNVAKGISGVFVPSESNEERLIPLGKSATAKTVTNSLQAIHELMQTFEKYTVKYDESYGARVMEAIFYTFTAPFMFEVKLTTQTEEERNDIPQFLFLGGTAGSGKSSLLKALSRMVNMPFVMDYNSIVPTGGRRKKETIDALINWMSEQNVAPLFIDEVSDEFFTNRSYGNELIVNISNRMAVNTKAFPVMIGTTNADGYTLEERARRRSYYLKLDKVIDVTFRKESQPAYIKAYEALDDRLFLDFVVRLSERLSDDSLRWDFYSPGGKIDFLYHTRQIFREYYEIAKIPLPAYFPITRYDDSKDTNQEKWRKLFRGTSMKDFKFDDYTGNLLFKTATLDENMSRFGGGKPSEIYKNALSPKVIVGSKDSADIELDTPLFFEWMEVENPFEKEYKNELKNYYLVNRSRLKEDREKGIIEIDMAEVMDGRQAGAVEQYKHYLPKEIIKDCKEDHTLVIDVVKLCEWLEVTYKPLTFFNRLFSK